MDFGFYNPKTGTITTVTAPATTGVPTVITQDKLSSFGVGTSQDGNPLFPGFDRFPHSVSLHRPVPSTWTAYARRDPSSGQQGETKSGFTQANAGFPTIALGLALNPQFRQPVEAWTPESGTLVTYPDATAKDTQYFHLLESFGGPASQGESEDDDNESAVVNSTNVQGSAGARHQQHGARGSKKTRESTGCGCVVL